MKVGIIVPPIFTCPPKGYGGEIICWDLAEALAELGVEVHLFAIAGSQVPTGGYLHYVPSCTLENFWMYEQSIIKFYKNMLNDDEFVWHDYTHTHIIHDYLHWHGKTNVISTPWGVFIQRPFWRQHLVTWSRFQRELAIQQGFPQSTRYVLGGCNTDFFKPDPHKPFEKDGYFLFLARMHPDKRPDLFLEIAKQLPNEHFVLSGSSGKTGTPDHAYYGRYYHQMAEKIPNVKIVPDPSNQEQIELYRHAKAVIHPSLKECFGLVIVQALSCGTPVIVSNDGAFPEIVLEAKTGFLASTIEQYVNAVNNVDVLSLEKAREDALLRWSRQRVAKDFLQVYEDIAKGLPF